MNNNIYNIVIDARSGDVAVKSMIKNIMPNLSDGGILKTVHRVLGDYNGPKMSTRLMNGRLACAATLDLSFEILDRMTGPSWSKWRENSGNAFKKALRERVEKGRSSTQTEQLQLQTTPQLQLQPPQLQLQPPPQVGIKTAALQKALRSVNIHGSVRIDDGLGTASVIDTVRLISPTASAEYAAQMFTRVLQKDDRVVSIRSRTTHIKINGRGNKTPCTDIATLVEIIWMLPGGASRAFRRDSAETICRVMGGDLDLCHQIAQNNRAWGSIEGGEVMRQALLKPIEYKEVEKSTRVMERLVRDTIASLVGGEVEAKTPAGNIDVLSGKEVIEVKYYKQWKHGLGQVQIYHQFHPRLAMRLHLFAHTGEVGTEKYFAMAKSMCDKFGVRVTFQGAPALALEDGPRRVKRAREENLSSQQVRKRLADLKAEEARLNAVLADQGGDECQA